MSDFDNWEKQFNRQVEIVLKADLAIIEDAAEEFKTRVENRTPIGNPSLWKWPAHAGYVPGTLRASWTMSKSGSGAATVITVENPIIYGPRVEFGWSTQAPQGMMRITAMEWSSIIDKVAKNHKI